MHNYRIGRTIMSYLNNEELIYFVNAAYRDNVDEKLDKLKKKEANSGDKKKKESNTDDKKVNAYDHIRPI